MFCVELFMAPCKLRHASVAELCRGAFQRLRLMPPTTTTTDGPKDTKNKKVEKMKNICYFRPNFKDSG